MDQNQILVKLEELTQKICQAEGCILYDLELVGAGGARVLRVFIDKDKASIPADSSDETAQAGVGIQDCTNVSRALNEILDENDLIPGAYSLEVSTPGLDRRLRKPFHFSSAVGKKIWVQLNGNLGSFGAQKPTLQATKKFEEILKTFESDHLIFEMQGEQVRVPLSGVEKSKVVFEMKKGRL